ncbi:MAG: hypothetical protein L0K86_02700 [Actinomycetia bacterium]|nr:hypothetical protein [Actinomycetes bacterium]
MSEAKMLTAVNAAISREGFDDEAITAGQFAPRGATGGMFAGGVAGDEAGSVLGSPGDSVGTVGGALAGAHGVARSRSMPLAMVVGVSERWVYGFAGRSRSEEPHELVFRLSRAGLAVSVSQRLNVRTLTLDSGDGTRIELEGNRLPITHSRDVIDELRGRQ